MMSRLGARIAAVFRATAPDPFVLAVLLTILSVVLAVAYGEWGAQAPRPLEQPSLHTPDDLRIPPDLAGAEPTERPAWEDRLLSITGAWRASDPGAAAAAPRFESAWAPPDGAGLWRLLGFGMQMCLILVTGHALASSPPMAWLLRRLARAPATGGQAVALVAFVAAALALVNWGLGLIGGALLAREVGATMERRGRPAHYPLLAAAGYVGLLVWHGGLSGSAPLKVTTSAQIDDVMGGTAAAGLLDPMPLTQTLLSPLNLVVTGGLLVLAPLLLALMHPPARRPDGAAADDEPGGPIGGPEIITAAAYIDTAAAPDDGEVSGPARKPLIPRLLEDTPIVTLALVALIALWGLAYYAPGLRLPLGFTTLALGDAAPSGLLSLTPNTVNLTMLGLGLLLHGTPARYARAVEDAARGCAGIILQFPFYAGIMAVLAVSGLDAQFARGIADAADASTLPILTFASAGVVNLLVPSGGGQWAVQGPVAVAAAYENGVDPTTMVMSVAYGDQLTNMLQPFWALPLLAITGVKAREMVGYTALLMVVAAAWIVACLLVLG